MPNPRGYEELLNISRRKTRHVFRDEAKQRCSLTYIDVMARTEETRFGQMILDESQDFYKKQQLRELAMINGTLRDDGSQMSGSMSPFNSLGMKRAKTTV
ncbi:unnamed protein product [Cuscuta campestris]|uniref:Uncharacterized protein n=1 Tax=Cuscuta campestris TaxID=132261 RepID=A0A484M0W5_9ASTE|nr:unnamed protein product [Cuscuta campestris]